MLRLFQYCNIDELLYFNVFRFFSWEFFYYFCGAFGNYVIIENGFSFLISIEYFPPIKYNFGNNKQIVFLSLLKTLNCWVTTFLRNRCGMETNESHSNKKHCTVEIWHNSIVKCCLRVLFHYSVKNITDSSWLNFFWIIRDLNLWVARLQEFIHPV